MAQEIHPNIGVVFKMYECFGKGDMATLKSDVFSGDITWALPGHHPLSGVKNGPDEVIAFFAALIKTGIEVDVPNAVYGTLSDGRVCENHQAHGKANGRDYYLPVCSVYTIKNGKIADVRVFSHEQHLTDEYFWSVVPLKGLPGRLA